MQRVARGVWWDGAAAGWSEAVVRARRSGVELLGDAARVVALRDAARGGDARAAEELLGVLGAGPAYVREVAARAVAAVARGGGGVWPGEGAAAARAVEALVAALGRAADGAPAADPGCRVRLEAVVALGELRVAAEAAEGPLRRAIGTIQMENVGGAMEDTAVTLRAAAALVMAQLGCDCVCDLGLLLFDGLPDPERGTDPLRAARVGAARALGALGRPDGAAPLAIRLRQAGEAGEVLAECVDALRALGHPRAAEWIEPVLSGVEPVASVAAAAALCALRPEAGAAAVARRIAAADDRLAEALVLVLSGARSTHADEVLARLAGDRRRRVRAAAADALRERTGPSAAGGPAAGGPEGPGTAAD